MLFIDIFLVSCYIKHVILDSYYVPNSRVYRKQNYKLIYFRFKYAFSFSHQLEVHRFLPFGLMAGLALSAAAMCMTLPETYNQPTIENLSQDKRKPKEEQDGNENVNDDKEEEANLM